MSEFEESFDELTQELGLAAQEKTAASLVLLAGQSSWIKDSKLNLKSILVSEALDAKQSSLIAYAIAVNQRCTALVDGFAGLASKAGASAEEIAEMASCASLLSANNVLYRFRHFVGKESYQKSPARLRMNIMVKPVSGKQFFELASLAVSAVNGCEACVNSHEQSVLAEGATEAMVWEAVRIASVVVSVSKLF